MNMPEDLISQQSELGPESHRSENAVIPESVLEVAGVDVVRDLAVSQINLDTLVAESARKGATHLRASNDPGDREFADKIFSENVSDLYRVLCPFAAVGTTINVFSSENVVRSKNIAVAVRLALENHRAPVPKDPNPADRYFFGEWWACNKMGFFHQAALPLALAYGFNMLSVEYDHTKGLADLFKKVSPGQEVGICLSVRNQPYLKNRHGDLMEVRDGDMFYKLRTPNGLSPVKLVPDSHLVSLYNHNGKLIVADSFDLPTSDNLNADLAYETDRETLERSITGKALLLSRTPIAYDGRIIEMRLPDALTQSLTQIRAVN